MILDKKVERRLYAEVEFYFIFYKWIFLFFSYHSSHL